MITVLLVLRTLLRWGNEGQRDELALTSSVSK
jgi:hypothetical protein